MGHFVDQPWWVNLAVVLLPFVTFAVVYHLVRGRNCFECGHEATKLHLRRYYCDRCFRKLFGQPVVVQQRIAVQTSAAVPSVNGTGRSSRAKQRRRAGKKKAG